MGMDKADIWGTNKMKTYSNPISKKEAAELITRCLNVNEKIKNGFIDKLCTINDVHFLKDFNKTMTIKLRIFAPGMFQIIYEN